MNKWIPCLIVVTLALAATVPFLGSADLSSKGEAREAVFVLEILDKGPLASPSVHGEFFHHKPPLYNWAAAAVSLVVGGAGEWAIRLPSALFFAGCVLLTYLFASRTSSRKTAILAALILLASPRFFKSGIEARVDMALCFFIVAALFLLQKAAHSRRWSLGLYLCLTLGALTKGPVAVVLPVGVALVLAAVTRRWSLLKAFVSIPGVLILIGLPLAWLIPVSAATDGMLADVLFQENFGRFLGIQGAGASHVKPLYFYLLQFVGGFFPWIFFFLPALCFAFWRARRETNWTPWLPFVAFMVCFLFYSASSGKRGVYILPCYPFAALMVAVLLEQIPATIRSGIEWRPLRIGSAVVLGLAMLTMFTGAVFLLDPGLFPVEASLPSRAAKAVLGFQQAVPGRFVAALGLCLSGLLLLWASVSLIQRTRFTVPALVAAMITVLVLFAGTFRAVVGREESVRDLVVAAESGRFAGEPVYPFGKLNYTFCYYHGIAHERGLSHDHRLTETPLIREPAELAKLFAGDSRPILVLMRRRDYKRLDTKTANRMVLVRENGVAKKDETRWLLLSVGGSP